MGRMHMTAFSPSGKVYHARVLSPKIRALTPLHSLAISQRNLRPRSHPTEPALASSRRSHHLVRVGTKGFKFELPFARLLVTLSRFRSNPSPAINSIPAKFA